MYLRRARQHLPGGVRGQHDVVGATLKQNGLVLFFPNGGRNRHRGVQLTGSKGNKHSGVIAAHGPGSE
jgi:hypothetical protein